MHYDADRPRLRNCLTSQACGDVDRQPPRRPPICGIRCWPPDLPSAALTPRLCSPLSAALHHGPVTGARTEITLSIMALECHSNRALAHIRQKSGKIVLPPRGHGNPTPTALRIATDLWIAANALHQLPGPIGRRMPLLSPVAMRAQTGGADFAVSAATARGRATPNIAAMSDDHAAAITGERPMTVPMPIRVRKIHAHKARIAQPGHVDPELAHRPHQPCLSAVCSGCTDQAAGWSPWSALAAAAVD